MYMKAEEAKNEYWHHFHLHNFIHIIDQNEFECVTRFHFAINDVNAS